MSKCLGGMRSRATFLAAALLAALVPPAGAQPVPDAATLTPSQQRVTWQGSRFVDASTPLPELCVLPGACETFRLKVALGPGFWDGRPGAVQIGIQWKDANAAESESEYDDFDLYVYDADGFVVATSATAIAQSSGIASSAEVVDIPNAADGDYLVVVVPVNVADRAYRGVAMVQFDPPPTPFFLLPDLTAAQATGFHFAVGTYSLSRLNSGVASCYAEETLQDPGHPTRCLRFDATISNEAGDGPFLLEMDVTSLLSTRHLDRIPGAQPSQVLKGEVIRGRVEQVILRGDGTSGRRGAGEYYFHTTHGHIHYENFATYKLVSVADGSEVFSAKSDFCMVDVDDRRFGEPGNQARTHRFPDCNTVGYVDGSGRVWQRQGINRGWADVYTWDLPGQYIDVTGLPDGLYDLVITANPNGVLAEKDLSNNQSRVRLRLAGDTVTCVPDPYGCPPGT